MRPKNVSPDGREQIPSAPHSPLLTFTIAMFVCLIFLLVIVAADQITKWLAVILLEGEAPYYVIDGVLRFTYVENRGAAFGMLDDHRWVFLILSSVTIVGLCVYLAIRPPKSRWVRASLTLIIGGGIGNMIDRVLLGHVVDFIDFCAFPEYWMWVFNVADSCICVGVGMLTLYLILDLIRDIKSEKAAKKAAGEKK